MRAVLSCNSWFIHYQHDNLEEPKTYQMLSMATHTGPGKSTTVIKNMFIYKLPDNWGTLNAIP